MLRQVFLWASAATMTACSAAPPYSPPKQATLIMTPECAEEYKLAEPMTNALALQARLSDARNKKKARGILKAEDIGRGVNITFVSGQDKAVFPRCAIENTISGKCDVALDLYSDGSARNLEAICTHPMFEAYAIQMVQATVFEPVEHQGLPVTYPGILYPVAYAFSETEKP